eukprot:838441-Amphidinium_carterae.1
MGVSGTIPGFLLEDRCAQRGIPNDRVLCGVCSIGGKQNITYMPEGALRMHELLQQSVPTKLTELID